MGFLDDIELEEEEEEEDSVTESEESHRLLEHYGEGAYDITDEIIEYPTGKVFDCPCGHPHGVLMEEVASKCYSCNEYTLIDTRARERPLDDMETREARVDDGEGSDQDSSSEENAEDRDGEEDDDGQTGLSNWT